MTMDDKLSTLMLIEEIREVMLRESPDEHRREIVNRAFVYARNRVADGTATTGREARMAMAAFADGFCTGFHRAAGKECPQ